MKGVFQRVGMKAVPVGPQATEALAAVRDGHRFVADVHAARNPEQLNLFWSLCQVVADADDDDKDNVKRWLLHRLCFIDIWFEPDGTMHTETQSIAFESMEQAKFSRFMDASIRLMSERLGSAAPEFIRRFEELLDADSRAHFRKLRSAASPPTTPQQPRQDERELEQVGRGRRASA